MGIVNQRVPFVIESSGRGDREMDIFSRLLKDRVLFLSGGIDDEISNLIIAQLLFLSNEDPNADIHFYINSPGGSVSSGLAIYDTMQYLRCDVATYNVGLVQGVLSRKGPTHGPRDSRAQRFQLQDLSCPSKKPRWCPSPLTFGHAGVA